MRIYISGPRTRIPELNRRAFMEADEWLTSLGHTPLNPATIHLPDGTRWEGWMRADIKLLMAADGLALLPGWENSRGANIERSLAIALGFDVRPLGHWNPVERNAS